MQTLTKEELIQKLIEIRDKGWIPNARPGNQGGIGNTLEDLLGIEENNLPIPNAAEWELKTQRVNQNGRAGSMTTLFHSEPSPRALKFVPEILLPKYGWRHKEAGKKYPEDEMSFRQTINAASRTDRGFGIVIDRTESRIVVSFDANAANKARHGEWLASVQQRVGLSDLDPNPYWGFDDLFHIAGQKLPNCFYVHAKVKKFSGVEYFHYTRIMMLRKFSLDKFIEAIEKGILLVDFDARTGHNHGTKFRLKQDALPLLYEEATEF